MNANVFGSKITIKFDSTLDAQGFKGIYFADKKLILLEKTLTPSHKLQTLIHEMIHSIISRIGIDQTKMSHDLEEILCESIAITLVENWKLLKKVSSPD